MYDLPCCRQVKFVVSQSFFLTFHGKKKRALVRGRRPLTKLKSAVKFFVKNLFKLREIWYNVGIENSVIMGCRNAFGRNKPTNKNGVCMYRGFGTERPYFKKDR